MEEVGYSSLDLCNWCQSLSYIDCQFICYSLTEYMARNAFDNNPARQIFQILSMYQKLIFCVELCFNSFNFKRSKSLAALVLGWCYVSCSTSNIKVDLIGFWLTCGNLSRQHLHWTRLVCGILSSFVVCASYRYREVNWLINAIIRHEPHTSSSFFLLC